MSGILQTSVGCQSIRMLPCAASGYKSLFSKFTVWDCISSCVFVGNRLVKSCGPSPEELCTPCRPNRFTVQPKSRQCSQCTQCAGMWCGHPFCCLSSNIQNRKLKGGEGFLYSTFKVPIWPFLITLVEQKYLDTSGLGDPAWVWGSSL